MISTEHFKTIIDSIGDPVFVLDQECKFVFLNSAACEMFQIPLENWLGKTEYDFFPKEQADVFAAQNNYVLTTGKKDVNEEQITDGYGNVRTIITTKTLYTNDAGEKYIVGTLRDITERKKWEESLRRNQLQLQDTVDLAHIVYWEFDVAENVFIFNDPFYALYATTAEREGGYRMSREEYINRFVHPDDQALVAWLKEQGDSSATSLSSETFIEAEHRIVRRDGAVRHIIVRRRLIRDNMGRVIKRYGSNQDITERLEVEKAIRLSEEKYRLLIENSHDIIYTLTPDGTFTFVSPSWTLLLGHPTTGIVGKDYRQFVHPDDIERCETSLKKLMKNGGRQKGVEYRVRHADGSWRWHSTNGVALMDENGTIIGFEGCATDITEIKQATEALRVSEANFRALTEHGATVTFVVQGDKFIYVNPAFTAVTGYTFQDLASMNFWDLISPDMREIVRARGTARQKREEVPPCYDLKFITKSGEERYGSMNVTLVEFQKKPAVLGTLLDITERIRMEKALRESEEKYHNIFENAVMGIFRTSPEGRILESNMAMARICGYGSPGEMIKAYTDIGAELYVYPEERARLRGLLEKYDFIEHFETQFRRKDGARIWISMNVRGVRDPEGKIVFHEGTVEDITVRKQAEEALRSTHQRLSDIIEFLPDATFVIDNEKKVVAWNRACEEMTKIGKGEAIGKSNFTYSIPFYGDKRPMLIDYVANGQYELPDYLGPIKRNGNRLYAEKYTPEAYGGKGAYLACEASPLFDREGNVVGAIESLRDITELKHLETQLRQSQKMEAIGTLAGGIAHDFNNIITSLMGYAALMQTRMEKNSPLQQYVDQILLASRKAADLTQSLLTFSRQKPVSPIPLDMNKTIETVKKLLERLLTEDIELKTILTEDHTVIMADKSQVDQIFFNLITNARDAMPKGGVLTIKTDIVSINTEFIKIHGFGKIGRYVMVTVSDTGIGMDPAMLEKIFDPFFTTKEVGKGTGLGLATVYGIVKQHNGYITVESVPKRGTTFRIFFPTVEAKIDEEEDTELSIAKGNETILIAEDDTEVRDFVKEALQEYGYTIIEAVDGEDAIDKFKRNPSVDLVILDSVMPKKNGREVYEEIHGIAPQVKVLFTSGYTKDIVLDKGIEDKEFDFIAKPLLLDELLGKVRQMLDGQ